MADKIFVDTNILVYAHDADAGEKKAVAARRVADIWNSKNGVLSLQILQEFYVSITQKTKKPLQGKGAHELVEQYGWWQIVEMGVADLLEAINLQKRHKLSFWDSLVVRAALKAECAVLLSEDFNHGQKIGSLVLQNPFL